LPAGDLRLIGKRDPDREILAPVLGASAYAARKPKKLPHFRGFFAPRPSR
jgi:hypothetical protein